MTWVLVGNHDFTLIKNKKFYFDLWDVISWYQSPGLRELDEHSCESRLKLRIYKSFQNSFQKYPKKDEMCTISQSRKVYPKLPTMLFVYDDYDIIIC